LRWDPVTENIEGQVLEHPAQYRIYRRSGDKDFTALGEPVQEPEFTDAGLVNARLYAYKVRALALYGDTLQAGGASQEVAGVPRDLAPPPQPQNLEVIAVPGGVKLVWQAVAGNDLAGYRIYRRQEESGGPELIAEVGPDRNQYIDQPRGDGRKLYYSVTAFDTAQPANESLPTGEEFIDLR
jgi:fibronectin type 3 domain-containing protein